MGKLTSVGEDAYQGETTKVDLKEVKDARRRAGRLRPVLTVVVGTQEGKVFAPDAFPAFIGRHLKSPIRLVGHGISRQHARLDEDEDGRIVISDTDSSNGTYVNGVQVRRQDLGDDDMVQIGPSTVLKFSLEDNTETSIRIRQYEQATRDELTGAFNRRYLLGALKHELAYAKRHQVPLALALIDLDQLKQINDSAGHEAGDTALRELSRLIADNLREEDIFGRYAGDEFAILLRGQDKRRAFGSAERLRKLVQRSRIRCDDRDFSVTVSTGIATFSPGLTSDDQTMLKQADERLYEAKRAGKNCVIAG